MFSLCVSHRRRRPSGRPLNFSNLFFHLVCLVKTRSVATVASGPGWFLNLCVHLYTYHIYVATSLVNKSVGPYDIYSWWFVRFRTLENHRPPVTWKKNNNSQNKRKKGKKRLTESNKNHYRNRIYLFGLWRYARFSLCVTWHTISGRSWRGKRRKTWLTEPNNSREK